MLEIRPATEDDFERITEIYRAAREYMIRSGNPTQWGKTDPRPEVILADIREGRCRAVCDGEVIRGVFALIDGEEPTYRHIDGAWLNDGEYIAIHRVASDGTAHGIFRCAADHCKKLAPNVRIDTHADNKTMQRQIEKNGFIKCGTVYLKNGSPRIAYQWSADRDGTV